MVPASEPRSARQVTTEASPAATVVIPAWNRADGVKRSAQSVLEQPFDSFEIVVVDDGSDDGTADAARELTDGRVRLHRTAHQGVSGARNSGAGVARGRVLLFLDCDDEVLPTWLEELARPILQGLTDIVVSGWRMLEPDGQEWEWLPEPGRVAPDDLSPFFLAGGWAVDRERFLRSGGFDPDIEYGECSELALRLLCESGQPRLGVISRPLHLHRRKSGLRPGRQAAGARTVLSKHASGRSEFPRTWAMYHTIAGVDDIRNGHRRPAIRHFWSALTSDPFGGRRLSRMVVALLPPLSRRVWPRRTGSTP